MLTGWVPCSVVIPKGGNVCRLLGDNLVDDADNLRAIISLAEPGRDGAPPVKEKTRVVIL